MHQTLINNGWKKYYDCKSCPNNPKAYYNHDEHKGYDIIVKKKTQTFSIKLNNRTVKGPLWGYQLADTLKTYTWS